jgi:hypothetical protein
MRSFSLQLTTVLFLVLACAQFCNGQAQTEAASDYTFKTINVRLKGVTTTFTQAFAVNNQGEIVGDYGCDGCQQGQNGFLEVSSKFTEEDCALQNNTVLSDLNNKDEMVGTYAYIGSGYNGFIWDGGQCSPPISDPDGNGSTNAWGVNDKGAIAGFYTDSGGNYNGFLYSDGEYTTIDCPDTVWTRAYGIGNSGAIVGDFVASAGGSFQGMLYRSGKCTTIDYPGASSTSAKGINKSGQISGWYTDTSNAFHGFVKTGKNIQTLDFPKATNTLAFHINDAGQVAGWYTDASGGTHGFIATPKR